MLATTSAFAQQLDLSSLEKFLTKTKGNTKINVDASLLKFAASFLNSEKPDEASVKKLVEGMKGIYVRVFEFQNKGDYRLEDLKVLKDQLRGPDWTVFLQNKEPNEETEIWMHFTKGAVDGIVLISAEDSELVVINAVGSIRPEDLQKLGGQFGIPQINTKE
jgi:hypothetical protein